MKKAAILLTAILTLCSCSSNHSEDTYFVHAICFDSNDSGELEALAVIEKLSESQNGDVTYFTAVQSGKNLDEVTSMLTSRYKECYFATAEIYLLGENVDGSLIADLSKELCDSNDYPTKSNVIAISGCESKAFLECIKNEDDMKKIISLTREDKTNIVTFFADYLDGRNPALTSLTATEDGKIKKAAAVIFKAKEDKV